MRKLLIVTNKFIFDNGTNFYFDNIDLKSIPEALNKPFYKFKKHQELQEYINLFV